MKFAFQFSNLCGTVYRSGNLIFTPDGRSLLSPIGNRVSVFDLVNNKSRTLPFENRKDIFLIALSPSGSLLLTIDEDGRALLVHFLKGIVLSHFNFKAHVDAVKFSPDGNAASHGKVIQLWKTPSLEKEFAPFRLVRTFTGHFDDVTFLEWSTNSKYLLSGSRDLTARLNAVHTPHNFVPTTFSGHRDFLISGFFSTDGQRIYTVSKDGALFCWIFEPEEGKTHAGKWRLEQKHFFNQNAKVVSAAFHKPNNLLVVGFSSGIFGLYELPEFNNIHTLSISSKKINTVCINSTGEWLAFGSAKLGQLLVWEWQSETYILKQQGHYYDMSCIAYSPDGQLVASGINLMTSLQGDDGKVKLWNTVSGFCFVTFSEHKAPITGVVFSPNGTAVLSSSLDGTVRAFDIIRYRAFRQFEAPRPTQFSSLAVDPSGEVVAAASMDSFEILVWSMQTAKALDTLAGHQAPVSALAFNPVRPLLASGSWDKTVRLWDLYRGNVQTESLTHNSDVIAIAWRPDGKELCSSTIDGNLQFWDVAEAAITGVIEGRQDISGGRRVEDVRTAKNSTWGKAFNSLCYTADGSAILAGGNSKYVCIYDVRSRILLKKFQTTHNRSLDGVLDYLNSKEMTAAGPLSLIDDKEADEPEKDEDLPGVRKESIKKAPAIRTKHVQFSPTARSWAAATTEGLLIFSLDETLVFDPFQLDINITPDTIRQAIADKSYLKALLMSFRLNEAALIAAAFEAIPPLEIQLVVRDIPVPYLFRFLKFLAKHFEESTHVEYHLIWVLHVFNHHGRYLKSNSATLMSIFRALHKQLTQQYRDLAKTGEDNRYTLEYLTVVSKRAALLAPAEEEPEAQQAAVAPAAELPSVAPKASKLALKAKRKRSKAAASKTDD